ncbi:hypothetical protein SLS62_008431 [Diatrype stigma]|uniref:AAA+ ATPase lid domain-containing protein n=1 Tax=Diatrype stigma TaxID=117547 RepID=A0AAN9UKH5_9PEZI
MGTAPSVGVSEVTSRSSAPKHHTVHNSDKPVTGEAETSEPNAKPPSARGTKGEQETAIGSGKKDLGDEVRSDDSPDLDTDLGELTARNWSPQESAAKIHLNNIFKVYEKRQTRDDHFLGELLTYMRVMNDRIGKVETRLGTTGTSKIGGKPPTTPTIQQPKGDKAIEVSVKFFHATFYLNEDGSFPEVFRETEKGTFVCDHDTQHLIRVLYYKKLDDGTKPRKEADLEPPKAADIDIVQFGVSSEAIATFFAKQWDIAVDSDHILRFMKPFRPVLRNLGPVREQLKKLKRAYGRMSIDGTDKSWISQENQDESQQATTNRDESEALPFASVANDEVDVQIFDQPIALLHFQAFVDFVDEYLDEQIQLFERYRQGKEQHVSFENLWMFPVVVDLRLAFEGGSETKKGSIEIPAFRSPTSLWLTSDPDQVGEIYGDPGFKWSWGACTDLYYDSQKEQRGKIESEVKLVLEEYENLKQRGEEGLEHFRKLMASKDLIRLLPGSVPAFALRNRKWVLLDLNQLGPVQQNNEWDKLVLPTGHRELVQAMVETHTQTHTQELYANKDTKFGMDLIQGKVFLRILEYYSGILFLTTNRVGALDDAFRSRLHLMLYYPKLTKKQTQKIFKQNFERVGDINIDREKNGLVPFQYKDSEKGIIDWAKDNYKPLSWNGRQIRNTFQTVLALAEFHAKRPSGPQNPVVTKKLFKVVANASMQFNEYLLHTHGADEDMVAKRDFMRATKFSPSNDLAFRGFSDSSSEEEEDDEGEDDSNSAGSESDSESSDDSDKVKKKKSSKGKAAKGAKSSSSSKGGKSSRKKHKAEKKSSKKKEDTDSD